MRESPLHLPPAFAVLCPACGEEGLDESHPACGSCGFALEARGRIVLLEAAPIEADYPVEGSDVQDHVSSRHFWFGMRNRFILQLMDRIRGEGRRLVEYGMSNGLVLRQLEQAGWDAAGNDMHMSGLQRAADLVAGPVICAPLEKVVFRDPVDVACFFDVIEHLPDELPALEHAVRQLRPGGHLVVTVPASQSLWSDFDGLLGHKRRYSAGELKALFDRLDLDVVLLRYAFFFSYPLVWLQRKLLRSARDERELRASYYRPPHPVVNSVLRGLCRLEALLVQWGWSPPVGTSVMGLARKREE